MRHPGKRGKATRKFNARRRCSKGKSEDCREWQPCPKHPHGWASNKSRKLPGNWKKIRETVIALKGLSCAHCGVRKHKRLVTVDHIIPRSHGGTDEIENLQVLCQPCHDRKTKEDRKRGRA